jgi:hypothetical protein
MGTMTPNSIRAKQELYSIVQALAGLAILILVLAGISGTVYKVIAPEGWLAQAFGRSLSAGATALGALALVAGLAWFSRAQGSVRSRSLVSDFLVYGFAAAGFLYLAQLWTRGTL